jgi:F0F1-type ATP synthase membrane subunit b/b'
MIKCSRVRYSAKRRVVMAKNSDKDDFVELGGAELRRVKNGLDEAQVASFISELISQRDKYRQQEEHLSSLTRLAEKTVTEADKLAQEIKTEAKDQAKAEASAIITKAEEQAQRIIEEKQTEIMNIATEQAEAIKTEAEREAQLLLENQRKKIKLELSNLAHQLYSHLLSELESLKQQVVGLEEEFDHNKLPHPAEETSTVTIEQDERRDEFMELIQTEDRESTGEPDWELEILPPIDITKIMGVVTYLDSLPEVESTEIIPETDSPSIVVFLREPINLTDVMRTLPEVAQVKEDMTDTAGANTKPRKVQMVLLGETVLDETKERLNSEVS